MVKFTSKKFEVYITCDNAAFEERYETEIVRMLGVIREKLLKGEFSGIIQDFNGNTVGNYLSR